MISPSPESSADSLFYQEETRRRRKEKEDEDEGDGCKLWRKNWNDVVFYVRVGGRSVAPATKNTVVILCAARRY